MELNLRNPEYGLMNCRTRGGHLQPQHFNTTDNPKVMLTAPFLQYTALTPGQKSYLRSVCEAYGEAHVRKLMQQHYLNVLHRSFRPGIFITNTHMRTSHPDPEHLHQTSVQQKKRSEGKAKGKSTSQKMIVLPKINNQQKGPQNQS